jgi:hypothetical protein
MDARAIPLRRAIIEEALGSRGSEDGERRQALRRSRSEDRGSEDRGSEDRHCVDPGAKTRSEDRRSEDRHCVDGFEERRQALRRSILSQSRQGVARNWQD